jgi:hypothetical protein
MRIITGTIRSTQIQWLPILANIAPPDLRRKECTKRILYTVKSNQHLPLFKDITEHPLKRLKSRHPIWDTDTQLEPLIETWENRWKTSAVRNCSLVENPEVKVPGYDLSRELWSTLNRVRTEQGKCGYNLHRWGMSESPFCECGEEQTVRHIVDTCPGTRFEGGIEKLHRAEPEAIIWMKNLKLRL